MKSISLTEARRLAVRSQLLEGERPRSSPDAVLDVAEQLRCIQIDPINVVARTQLLVLWSRLSRFDPKHLDVLVWDRKELFHYWAHAASLVLTSDYPLHKMRMRRFSSGESFWGRNFRDWMKENAALRRQILAQLRKRGALRSRDLESVESRAWESTGWTGGQTVSRMLDFMWTTGEIMIVGRDGLQRIWDLSERWFPEWTPKRALTAKRGFERAAELAFVALGVATPQHVRMHFVRYDDPDQKGTIASLEKQKVIYPIEVRNGSAPLKGKWYIHRDAVPLLDEVTDRRWKPRTTLLSPFDNLIADRKRTLALFDFDFKIEIYIPKAKRKFGYYALPILHGEEVVGCIDASVDRKEKVFRVLSVYAEPGAPKEAADDIGPVVADLARFTGATGLEWPRALPRPWARALRATDV